MSAMEKLINMAEERQDQGIMILLWVAAFVDAALKLAVYVLIIAALLKYLGWHV